VSRPLTFAELAEGDRFLFLWEQGESRICTKTGPRDYVAGEYAGHVGVGDNPVRRVPATDDAAEYQPARVVATVDGRWMILVNGFQWGGTYDRSGAGDATFDSSDAAILAWTDAGHARASIAVERRR